MPSAIFLLNLLQDVSILRPLVFLAKDLGLVTEFLAASKFIRRDRSGIWQRELQEISEQTGTPLTVFESTFEASQKLQGRSGIIIAGSESNLSAHSTTHDVLLSAPLSFLRVTLQHGFECVGFRQSRDHDTAHGRAVTFAADVVCGWSEGERLYSMVSSQRPKLFVSGPPMVLQPAQGAPSRVDAGIVCENLHSVRLNMAGNFKKEFMSIFDDFCTELGKDGRDVVLRPHPGGQYVIKNKVALPSNVRVNNDPIYKVDLRQYAYGISAPSSVLIDMMLAGIPVAVWRDADGKMDADNYDGLTEIHSAQDWLDFSREAVANPEPFLERQRIFLAQQQMPIQPADVRDRFKTLFTTMLRRYSDGNSGDAKRVVFVANSKIPTLEINFLKPLQKLVETGELAIDFISEEQMKGWFGTRRRRRGARKWLDQRLSSFNPSLIVFCRFSGPHAEIFGDWATQHNVPVIYHIDDDLLHVPLEIVGQLKFDYHNDPARLGTVGYLLDRADLVYCSTRPLAERLKTIGVVSSPVSGAISCSGRVLVDAGEEPVRAIGYMGFDHALDFKVALPAVVTFLRQNPQIRFELFGAIPKPPELDEFGNRIVLLPTVKGYEDFLAALIKRKWQIGICPLADVPFNSWKSVNKWVEYTAVGAAVVATGGTIYDDCCAGGCGVLVRTSEEWLEALNRLVRNASERSAMVTKAQVKLREQYSTERLREQVLEIFNRAMAAPANRLSHLVRYGPSPGRVVFISNEIIPTLEISFALPLRDLVESGYMKTAFITERQLKDRFGKELCDSKAEAWLGERLAKLRPTLLVFCRYSGPHAEYLRGWARDHHVPTIYHIDDDLLNVPPEVGEGKAAYHNDPKRRGVVASLLGSADLVYCSTRRLAKRFRKLGAASSPVAAEIYCAGQVRVVAREEPVTTIGYMGTGHERDLEIAIPAIVSVLRQHPELRFELFGLAKPAALDEFGDRITVLKAVKGYERFLASFAERKWQIGICPLVPTPFNLVKTEIKWIDYTCVGAAVIASAGTVYDECCKGGCGLLAKSSEEWTNALSALVQSPHERFAMVVRAQKKIEERYTTDCLRRQVLKIFNRAKIEKRRLDKGVDTK